MADRPPSALILNAGQDGELMYDYLIKNRISVGWSVGDPSEDRYRDFRRYSAEDIYEDKPSGDDRRPVAKFLRVHDEEEKNTQIGDDVIVYAPDPEEVVVGVFTVREAEYGPNPLQLTDETHYYYRDAIPKPWSKPVDIEDFKKHYKGDKPISVPPTLQPFYGDLTEVKSAIQSAPRADIEPKEVTFQRRGIRAGEDLRLFFSCEH
jgi:predicted transcriptional regulator